MNDIAIVNSVSEWWSPVRGFPGYSVSSFGMVQNDTSKRSLTIRRNQFGVAYVGLMRNGRQCIRSLPRLVLAAFMPQPNEIFDTPINLNGDRTNCSLDNLMWRPRLYAVRYVNQFQDPYTNPIMTQIRDVESKLIYSDSFDAACSNGLLEREVVLSILNHTVAWPTYQRFEVVE